MASQSTEYTYTNAMDHRKTRICILTAQWHSEIVEKMYLSAVQTLTQLGVENIERYSTPGSYELPFGARLVLDTGKFDALICFGVIVKGETQHDEFIAQTVSNQISSLSAISKIPVLFGVLTTLTLEQANERAGGTKGDKGKECAIAALELLDLKASLKDGRNTTGFKFA